MHEPEIEPKESYKADVTWFHIFKEMIRNKTWARLTSNSKSLYPVIKAYINWASGAAFPSLDTLEEYSGLARASVVKALKELEREGLLVKLARKGRGNNYRLIEKFAVQDAEGELATGVSFPYKPRDVEKCVAEIKQLLSQGLTTPDGKTTFIKIENLTLNIAMDHGRNISNNINIDVSERKQFIQGIRDMVANKQTDEAQLVEDFLEKG